MVKCKFCDLDSNNLVWKENEPNKWRLLYNGKLHCCAGYQEYVVKCRTESAQKKIQTRHGEIEDTKEQKEFVFGEETRIEYLKTKEAFRKLFVRLSDEQKEKAYKWIVNYRVLVSEEDEY